MQAWLRRNRLETAPVALHRRADRSLAQDQESSRTGCAAGGGRGLGEVGLGGPVMTKDESEAFYQMLEALMSARRYILAQQYYPPERLAEIDAAIRHAEAEQRGHLTGEN